MSCTHTKECDAARIAQETKLNLWIAAWPYYCPYCEGRGGAHDPGYFDHRAGIGEPPSFEPCGACACHGRCARCRGTLTDQETGEGPCTACGWNFDDELPELYDCECWMIAEQDVEWNAEHDRERVDIEGDAVYIPGRRVRFKEWCGFGKWLSIETGQLGTIIPNNLSLGVRVLWDNGRECHHWTENLELVTVEAGT